MVEPKTARPGGGRAEALSTLTRTTCSAERSWRARYSAAQERRSSRAYSAAKARVRVEHMRRQRADAAVPKIATSENCSHLRRLGEQPNRSGRGERPLQLPARTRREPALRPYRRARASLLRSVTHQTYRTHTSLLRRLRH